MVEVDFREDIHLVRNQEQGAVVHQAYTLLEGDNHQVVGSHQGEDNLQEQAVGSLVEDTLQVVDTQVEGSLLAVDSLVEDDRQVVGMASQATVQVVGGAVLGCRAGAHTPPDRRHLVHHH